MDSFKAKNKRNKELLHSKNKHFQTNRKKEISKLIMKYYKNHQFYYQLLNISTTRCLTAKLKSHLESDYITLITAYSKYENIILYMYMTLPIYTILMK